MTVFTRTGCQLAVAAGLVLVPATPAYPAIVAKIPSPRTQLKATQQHASVLAQLHSAHAHLINADHDYQGHRARAAQEVAAAIHAITGKHHHHHAKAGGPNRPRMPQAQSDTHLAQASKILSTAVGNLPAGHKATAKVHAALNEINTALKVK